MALARGLSGWTNLHNNVLLQDFDSKHLPRGAMLGKQHLCVSMTLAPNLRKQAAVVRTETHSIDF